MGGGELRDFFREKDHLLGGGGQGLKGCGTCAGPRVKEFIVPGVRDRGEPAAIANHRAASGYFDLSAGPAGVARPRRVDPRR